MTEAEQAEIVAQIEAELDRLRVSDVLLHTVSAVGSLAYRRLADDGRDLEQVRLAIETLRALVPLLEGKVPEEVLRDFRQVTANLQLAYAAATAGPAAHAPAPAANARAD